MREAEVERCLVKAVERHGGVALKLYIFKGSGMPDRTCLFPNGRMLCVELKTPSGKLRASQISQMRKLQKLGFICGTVWNCEEAEEVVELFVAGKPLPKKFWRL